MAKSKFYAVRKGREGPRIYNTWDECKANTTRFHCAEYKSFYSKADAERWINAAGLIVNNRPGIPSTRRPAARHDSDSEIEFVEGPSIAPTRQVKQEAAPLDDDSDIEFVAYNPSPSAQSPSHSPATPPPVTPPYSEPISLSPEQKRALDLVKSGRSVFYTGSAGTGKSVLLREIISWLGSRNKCIAITASTGIAAINIGGTTLHSWSGIGIGQDDAEKTAIKFFTNKERFGQVLKRWHRVNTLIIDEVSMLDGRLFDMLEGLARKIRENEAPFGGIQLILSGDFCQLPPVPNRNPQTDEVTSVFAFEAQSWDRCVGPPIVLRTVFRQKEQKFVDMLNSMRFGKVYSSMLASFRALSREVKYDDGIEPTELFPTRNEVDRANSARLRQIPRQATTYQSYDISGKDSKGVEITYKAAVALLDNRSIVPSILHLKVGAQVMLVKNIHHEGLVNGSIGQIERFCTVSEALKEGISIARIKVDPKQPPEQDPDVYRYLNVQRVWPIVRFTSGKRMLCIPLEFEVNNASGGVEARRDQVPLILAWALSIHKSQGQTLERVKVNLEKIFENGQAYVALSRATKMEQLQVLNFDPTKITAHPRVIAWYQKHGGTDEEDDFGNYLDDFDYVPSDNSDDEMDSEMAVAAYYH